MHEENISNLIIHTLTQYLASQIKGQVFFLVYVGIIDQL